MSNYAKIASIVLNRFKITEVDLNSKSRLRNVTLAKRTISVLLKSNCEVSRTEISRLMDIPYDMVGHYLRTHEDYIEKDSHYAERFHLSRKDYVNSQESMYKEQLEEMKTKYNLAKNRLKDILSNAINELD